MRIFICKGEFELQFFLELRCDDMLDGLRIFMYMVSRKVEISGQI